MIQVTDLYFQISNKFTLIPTFLVYLRELVQQTIL